MKKPPRVKVPSVSESSSHGHDRLGPSLSVSGGRRSSSVRSQHSRSSTLSLEGPHETVLIPAAEGHEPGRVGSALSMRSEIAEENYDEDEDENDEYEMEE